MAIIGTLAECPMDKLLDILRLGRKTGLLTVRRGKEKEMVQLHIHNGRLELLTTGRADNLLDILSEAGTITQQQRDSLATYKVQADKELAVLARNGGYIAEEEIISALHSWALDKATSAFSWTEGSFRYDDATVAPPERILLSLSLKDVIARGKDQVPKVTEPRRPESVAARLFRRRS